VVGSTTLGTIASVPVVAISRNLASERAVVVTAVAAIEIAIVAFFDAVDVAVTALAARRAG
jgi:hypothetical protein